MSKKSWLKVIGPPSPLTSPREEEPSFWRSYFSDFKIFLFLWWIETLLLPHFLWKNFFLHLMSPWLMMITIEAPLKRSLIWTFFVSLLEEGQGLIPKGFYFCAYGTRWIITHLVKQHISWRRSISWMVAFGLSEAWLIVFEILIVTDEGLFLSENYIALVLSRLWLSTLVGYGASLKGQRLKKGI